jgi:hypothetical protein
MWSKLGVLTVLLAGFMVSSVHATPVELTTNGSFSDGGQYWWFGVPGGNGGNNNPLADWTFSGTGSAISYPGATWLPGAAGVFDAMHVLIGDPFTMTQTLGATLQADTTYTVTLYAMDTWQSGACTADITLWAGGVGTGTDLVEASASSSLDAGTLQTITASFTTPDGTTPGAELDVVLTGVNNGSQTFVMGGPSVTADTATPEPATISLLVLGGLAMLKRRK